MENYPDHPDIAEERVRTPGLHESETRSVDENGERVYSEDEIILSRTFPDGIKIIPTDLIG